MKIIASLFLLLQFVIANEIYSNGQIINTKKAFKELSNMDLANISWNDQDYIPYLYNSYHKNDKGFKSIISYKDYLDKEFKKLKYDYIYVFSSGKSKKEFIELYLEVFNKSLDTSLEEEVNLKQPMFYNKMIRYVLNKVNNENINEMENSLESLQYISKYYNLFNYGGKINALNKVKEILLNIEINEEILLEISSLKPNYLQKENIDLIIAYNEMLYGLTLRGINIKDNFLKDIKYNDNLIELVSKFYSYDLTREEYILLKRKIDKENLNFQDYLVESDYIQNLLEFIDKNIKD